MKITMSEFKQIFPVLLDALDVIPYDYIYELLEKEKRQPNKACSSCLFSDSGWGYHCGHCSRNPLLNSNSKALNDMYTNR